MSNLNLFIPISKVDEAKRIVYGTITEEVPDKAGEMFDYASGKEAIRSWSDEISESTNGKSKGNVRAMHGNTAAGKFTDIHFDDANKRIEGAAKVVDDNEWQKVIEGVYTGFSIGGGYKARWKDDKNPEITRYTPTISEVSLVDNPCVPTATFEYVKADGSVELRKFNRKEETMTTENSNAEVGAVKTVENGKAVKPKIAPVQKNVWVADDGSEHPNKREAEVHNLTLEKQAEIAPSLTAMEELLKGAKKTEAAAEDEDDDKDGDDEETKGAKKARREEKAAKAQADKEKAEKDDAEMAAKAAKEKADEEAKKAADAAELAKEVPAVVVKTQKPALKKGLWGISQFAQLLDSVSWAMESAEYERVCEGDESVVPEKIKAWLKAGTEILKEMVDEETAELFKEGSDNAESVEKALSNMTADGAVALAKFITNNLMPLHKAESGSHAILTKFVSDLEKAGAKHSAKHKEAMTSIHKSAADHLAHVEKCFKEAGIIEDSAEDEGGKPNQKMSKMIEAFNAQSDELVATRNVVESLNKTMLEAVTVMKASQEENSELRKRMENLEAQPVAPKGYVTAISKAGDEVNKSAVEAAQAELAKMSPEEQSRTLMKMALRNPVSVI